MDQNNETIYDAAEALDALLGEDDGAILAAMAFYKTSLLELFGRQGIVEIMRQAVDEAPHVDYFSKRSRREIDPGRPEVNLRVDDFAAMTEQKASGRIAGFPFDPRTCTGKTDEEHAAIARFKTEVIFQEVCQPMATKMNAALLPHWERAKVRLVERGLDPNLLRMLLCNMFVVRVGMEVKTASADKMCVLGLFV